MRNIGRCSRLVRVKSPTRFTSHLADKGHDIDFNQMDSKNINALIQVLTLSLIDIDSDK